MYASWTWATCPVLGIVEAYEKSLVTFSKFEDIYITGKGQGIRINAVLQNANCKKQ